MRGGLLVGYVLRLTDVRSGDAQTVGGKAIGLAALLAAGLPIPDGFVVTTEAYRAGSPMSAEVERQVREAYAALCAAHGDDQLPVAVRSSASDEDSGEASFAGEHDTYLWVRGGDQVITSTLGCWASLYTERAIAYRAELGLADSSSAMAVVVQAMVSPEAAGVAFTLNPADGDRSVVAIDSAWGFGEGVVSGSVTPDNFLVSKVSGEVVARTISRKERQFLLVDQAVVEVPVPGPAAEAPSIQDEVAVAIASMAREIEIREGIPQDVEWAMVREPDGTVKVVLLQTRPETVWSRRAAVADDQQGAPVASIVSALLNPLHTRHGS